MDEEPPKSKNTVDAAVPRAEAVRQLDEDQKKALELGDRAEHETGQKREELQKEARRKAENG
ncbi:MAG TPA: hypothetical protein VFS35_04530 [Terrimicrobiaceae bacterium]|nr:hypothetical protein [Terrimicrobiaceae bacterium]